MHLTIYFLHSPLKPQNLPGFAPISGDFGSIETARKTAIETATKNPEFVAWCAGFEIADQGGKIVSRWSRGDA